ncbi:TPA: hypothetical protein ACP7SG_004976, partial [Escherichia coli]
FRLTDYKASKVGKTFLVLKKSTLKVGFFCIFILFTTPHLDCQIKLKKTFHIVHALLSPIGSIW